MWIRHQDEYVLVNVNDCSHIAVLDKYGGYLICGYSNIYRDMEDYLTLGMYKNKDRATEVLNEIQQALEKERKIYIMPFK
jgi:hypothetical protein